MKKLYSLLAILVITPTLLPFLSRKIIASETTVPAVIPQLFPPTETHAAIIMGAVIFAILVGMGLWRFMTSKKLNRKLAVMAENLEKAQNKLQFYSRQNELVLKAAGEGIFGLDIDGKLTFINPAAEKMVGYSSDELMKKRIHAIIHSKNENGKPIPFDECRICKSISSGKVLSGEDTFWRKDGSHFPVKYNTNPVNENYGFVGIVVTFSDITERKQAEEKVFVLPLLSSRLWKLL
jgi:PAS domain S-box-containing protein